jgi:DNA mismatch endonuclease (patch repair protein)
MNDVVSPQVRSRMMSSIGRRNTAPELAVRSYLFGAGLRFRVNDRRLPGSPDIVLKRYGVVVFVHGCFWHRHSDCRFAATPSTRREFWAAKFAANIARDQRNENLLVEMGWTVLTVWECDLCPESLDKLFWKIVSRGEPNGES